MNDFEKVLGQTVRAQNNIYRAALSTHPAQRRLDAILNAYERTKNDPQQTLSTVLMCAIEAARG